MGATEDFVRTFRRRRAVCLRISRRLLVAGDSTMSDAIIEPSGRTSRFGWPETASAAEGPHALDHSNLVVTIRVNGFTVIRSTAPCGSNGDPEAAPLPPGPVPEPAVVSGLPFTTLC